MEEATAACRIVWPHMEAGGAQQVLSTLRLRAKVLGRQSAYVSGGVVSSVKRPRRRVSGGGQHQHDVKRPPRRRSTVTAVVTDWTPQYARYP